MALLRKLLLLVIGLYCTAATDLHAQRAEVQGRWVRDSMQGCQLYVSAPGRRIVYQGNCRRGYAHGAGDVTLYGASDNNIIGFYEGYFLNGYFIADEPTGGTVTQTGRGLMYTFNPRGKADYRLHSKLIARGSRSSVCSRQLFITVADNVRVKDIDAASVANEAMPFVLKLCRIFGREGEYKTLNVNFVRPDYLQSRSDTILKQVKTEWDGSIWRATESTTSASRDSGASGSRQSPANRDDEESSPASQTPSTSAQRQGLSMMMSARLVRAADVRYPSCIILLSLRNTGSISINGIAVRGAIIGSDNRRQQEFRLERNNFLVPGAVHEMQKRVPSTICNYIQTLKIDRIACSTKANRPIPDCKPVIALDEVPAARETANTEQIGLKILY